MRNRSAPKGVLVVLPGPIATIGWRKHSRASFVDLPLELRRRLRGATVADLNDVATAFLNVTGSYIPDAARIIFCEREPKSRYEAHAQNMLAKVAYTFAACRGLPIDVVHEFSFPVPASGYRALTPRDVEAELRRDGRAKDGLCYRALRARSAEASESDYAELLSAIRERRLRWPNYTGLRLAAGSKSLWERAMGASV